MIKIKKEMVLHSTLKTGLGFFGILKGKNSLNELSFMATNLEHFKEENLHIVFSNDARIQMRENENFRIIKKLRVF